MYKLLRFFLFQLDAENAHHLTLSILKRLTAISFIKKLMAIFFSFEDKRLQKTLWGITFPNPIGLAAGLDKNATCIDGLSTLGFGFVEIGTVTPLPQDGNEQPRLFRIIDDNAIVNRMGFNNDGVAVVKENILKLRADSSTRIIIGGNIGKNKSTPNEQAIDDYLKCFHVLFDVVDYFVVNISSPNTPNLRALQEREPLTQLLTALQLENAKYTAKKPILLKIAPDVSFEQLDEILEVIHETQIEGIIATNTTISREGLSVSIKEIERIGAGGLSGKPLTHKSTAIVAYIAQQTNGKLPIIAVGGIMTAQDALDKLKAGASLIQLYSGFIYRGPKLIKEIKRALLQQL